MGLRARFEKWTNRRPGNIVDYSMQESSTPIDPADTSGGSAQLTISMGLGREAKALRDRLVDFEDGSNGTTQAIVRDVDVANDFTATITADSRLLLLNEKRITKPYRGSLAGAFRYYFGLVGLTERILIDEAYEEQQVKIGGFEGNLWEAVRELCVAKRVELSLVSDNIVVRGLRQRTAVNYRNASMTEKVNTTLGALSIRVSYYEPRDVTNHLIYPAGGWNDDVSIISVNAGETQEIVVDLPGSFERVKQPRPLSFVGPNEASDSVYTIAGNDGLPVPVRQWNDYGGSITVEISENTRQATIKVRGASLQHLSPFSIAMASDTSDGYSSLRIVGDGLLLEPQVVELETGADENKVTTEVGVDVQSEFISSKAEAYDAAIWSLMKFSGPNHTVTVETSGINRKGASGSTRYPKLFELNALYDGISIYEFNQAWGESTTIGDFNEVMFDRVRSDFANQAFGNVAGARVRIGDAFFRIRDATISASSISYSAEADTTLGDFRKAWAGFQIVDFNNEWAGLTIGDFNVSPLRRDPLMIPSAIVGYGSGPYGRRRYGG